MPFRTRKATVSLSDRVLQASGKSSGFDYLRICLALSVVGWHSVVTSYGTAFQAQVLAGPWRLAPSLILPMFFSLSGFLVTASLQRNTVPAFVGLRVLRIAPALAIEVAVSALILGPLLTTLPLAQYFADTQFLTYLMNIVGDIHYFLPGVFTGNPMPLYVNGQLWTIPFELECYLFLAAMALIGLGRNAGPLVCAVLSLQFLWAGSGFMHGEWSLAGSTVPWPVLPLCFLAGVALYHSRERIPASWAICAAAAALTAIGLSVPLGDYFIAFPIAYLTIMLGLLNPRKLWLVRSGDYSYGVYLYGFPVQQMVAGQGAAFHHWYANLAVSVPLTVGLAVLSWKVIEKPALGLRRHVRRLDGGAAWLRQRGALLAGGIRFRRLPP